MANSDIPLGFRPVTNEAGTIPKLETFTAKTGITIYEGSPVVLDVATGLVDVYTDQDAVDGNVLGVAAHYLPLARVDREIQVYTDVNQEYELQSDDASLTTPDTYMGILFRITNPAAGSADTGQSIAEITGASGASVTGTAAGTVTPIRVERISTQINNEPAVAFTRYIVRFIWPVMVRGMGTIGIGAGPFEGAS